MALMRSIALLLLIFREILSLTATNSLIHMPFVYAQDVDDDKEITMNLTHTKNSSLIEPAKNNISNYNLDSYSITDTDTHLVTKYFACPPNYKQIQGKCYAVYDAYEGLLWTSAQKICEQIPAGQLAVKPSENWLKWMKSLPVYDTDNYWVNLHKTQQGWFWPNGDKAVEWAKHQPNGVWGSNACAVVSEDEQPGLSESSCSYNNTFYTQKGFICEAPVRGICNENECVCFHGYYGESCQYECSTNCVWPYICSDVGNISVCRCHDSSIEDGVNCRSLVICPANFLEIFGRCYRPMEAEEWRMTTWRNAQISCQNDHGGSLAEPPNLLWMTWIKVLKVYNVFYWVNLRKTPQGWHWPSGKEVQHWKSGEPNGDGGDDACAQFLGGDNLLKERSCNFELCTFICEAPKTGCLPGYFGDICSYGFHMYIWLIGAIISILLISVIALLIYIRLQHVKYKREIEYEMNKTPRGHCIIMYTREDNIYISKVDFTPTDPENLQLHKGQIIELISLTEHEDILIGKPFGVDNAMEGYFAKNHVEQSLYGLADANLCSVLWRELNFTVHKLEVTTVEDFRLKLLNCRELINSDERPQNCFTFTFIGHGYSEEKAEFIELKGYTDIDNESAAESKYQDTEDTSIENVFVNDGFQGEEDQCLIDCIKKTSIDNSDKLHNSQKQMPTQYENGIDSVSLENMVVKRVGFQVKLIYEMFTPYQCPKLVGVPKLFYVQACRGDKADKPLHMITDGNHQACSNESAGRAFIPNTNSKNQIDLSAESLGTYSDLYVYCSSFAGYFSYFTARNGKSFFIEELCNVYKKDHKKHKLSEMNTKVNNNISKIRIDGEKQIPTISVDTLRKILRFK